MIAEGVEEAGQLKALGSLGCRYAQGFVLARPAAAEATLRAWQPMAAIAPSENGREG